MKFLALDKMVLYRYRYAIGNTLVVLLAVGTLCFFVGSLVPSTSQPEAAAVPASMNEITDNPIYAPHKLLQLGAVSVLGGNALAVRLPSLLFGLLTLGSFYLVLRLWHRPRIAVVGSLLLVTSSWFLGSARLGTPEISLALAVAGLLLAATQFHHRPNWGSLLGLAAAGIFTLYVPLGLYLLAFTLIALAGDLRRGIGRLNHVQRIVAVLALLGAIAPLALAIDNEALWRSWLGLPDRLPTLSEFGRRLAQVVAHVFWRSQPEPYLHLGNLPMLDFFVATMAAIGLYHYEQHFELRRTRLLIGWFFLFIILLALGGNQAQYVMLLPLVYIFAATGIITLLFQWYEIFPRNPVARVAALVPVAIVLAISANYQLSRYFVAWSRAPETRLAFSAEPKLLRERLFELERSSITSVLVVAPTDDLERYRLAGRGLMAAESGGYRVITSDLLNVSSISGHERILIASGIRVPVTLRAELEDRGLIVTERAKDSIAFYEFAPRKRVGR